MCKYCATCWPFHTPSYCRQGRSIRAFVIASTRCLRPGLEAPLHLPGCLTSWRTRRARDVWPRSGAATKSGPRRVGCPARFRHDEHASTRSRSRDEPASNWALVRGGARCPSGDWAPINAEHHGVRRPSMRHRVCWLLGLMSPERVLEPGLEISTSWVEHFTRREMCRGGMLGSARLNCHDEVSGNRLQ